MKAKKTATSGTPLPPRPMKTDEVRPILERYLRLEDSNLLGCRRRNLWGDDKPWRDVRGNALLYVLGHRRSVTTPVGPLEYFAQRNHLLQFRGGPWKTYWTQDFLDLWCLATAYGSRPLDPTIIVLHENKGELDVKEIEVPERLQDRTEATARALTCVQELLEDPPGRISKADTRASHVCRYCPVKQRCDAIDETRGETDDWGPAYPRP